MENFNYRAYIIGFGLSLIFTLAAYFLVVEKWLRGNFLLVTLSSLALLQAITQFSYFLHLGEEKKPRWHQAFFASMILVLIILVIGSLWIMFDLNRRVMPQ